MADIGWPEKFPKVVVFLVVSFSLQQLSTYFPTTASLSDRVAGHVSKERTGCYLLDGRPWSEVALVGRKWVLNLLLHPRAIVRNCHLFSVPTAPAAVWDGRGWLGLIRDSGGFEWVTVRTAGGASPASGSSLLLFSSATGFLLASLLLGSFTSYSLHLFTALSPLFSTSTRGVFIDGVHLNSSLGGSTIHGY